MWEGWANAAAGERPGEPVPSTSRPDDERPHAAIVACKRRRQSRRRVGELPAFGGGSGLNSDGRAQDPAMYEPGLDRHEWESEWQALEDDLRTDPAQALPELDRLVARMLADSGYELTDPVVGEGEEREIVAEYLAAHEIVEAAERDPDDISPGDFASAINGYRAVFDHPVAPRAPADADLGGA